MLNAAKYFEIEVYGKGSARPMHSFIASAAIAAEVDAGWMRHARVVLELEGKGQLNLDLSDVHLRIKPMPPAFAPTGHLHATIVKPRQLSDDVARMFTKTVATDPDVVLAGSELDFI